MSVECQSYEPAAQLGRVQPLRLVEAAPEPLPKDWPARPGALILVCGGRDYADAAHVYSVLDGLRPGAVVHGACGVDADRPRWARLRGADRLADAWCARRQVPVIRVPARWSALGRQAGVVRNQQMIGLYHPALVVAFPGHLGTADLVLRARAAGVPVWKPAAPHPSYAVRPTAQPGRVCRYRNTVLTLPADLRVPTCRRCKHRILSFESVPELAAALEATYRAELVRRAAAAIQQLGLVCSQRKLEVLADLSQGYLSRVVEALRRAGTVQAAAEALDRSRGFIHDSLRRRQREWASADWIAYGAELRRRRLLAGWTVAELSRRINLSGMTIHHIEKGRGRLRPTELTLAKLAAALGMPIPPLGGTGDGKIDKKPPLK